MMRNGLRLTASSLLAICLGLSPVFAQTPPEQIRDWPGLTYLGVVGGLEAWSVDGSDALWMRAPDGRGLIRGEMFSAAGRDLGAALTGADPAPLRETLEVTGPDWSSPTPELISAAMRLTMSDAFSIPFGDAAAPEVWAWMDLSEPSAPATYMMLRDLIDAGEISLRVIPVVTRDEGSALSMLEMLEGADPLQALRDRVTGSGASEDTPSNPAEPVEDLVSRIEANGALAARLNPPGLPFLLWSQENGPAAFVGVPGRDVFGSVARGAPQEAEAGEGAPATD